MKFEDLIKKIEEATQKIESGNVGLDESIVLYEQAMKDCKECYSILNNAKGKIEILNKTFCEDTPENKAVSSESVCDSICVNENNENEN